MKLNELKRFVNNKNKIPYVNNHYVRWSDEENWLTYDEALKNAQKQNLGISVVLGPINDEYSLAGIDFDTIRDINTNQIDVNIKSDIIPFKHTHVSVSGYGLHTLCLVKRDLNLDKGNRAKIKSNLNILRYDDTNKRKYPEIEFYIGSRTFALPLNLDVSKDDIVDSTEDFKNIYNKYMGNQNGYIGNNNSKKYDESRKDYKLIAEMHKKGYDRETIKKEFLNSDYAKNKDEEHKKKLNRKDYLDRTLNNVIDDLENDNANNNTKIDNILNLIKDNFIFIDERNTPYIVIEFKNVKIESRMFEEFIESLCYENNISIGGPTLQKIQKLLCNKARKENNMIELNVRFAGNNNEIYYQLSEKENIKITENGYEIITNNIPMFRKYSNMLDQVIPNNNGMVKSFSELFELINIDKSQHLIFTVYIISLFIPNIPKPILTMSAERGSGKSTATKIIKDLVDPSVLNTTRLPNDEQSLTQILDHSALICFDNISNISLKQSDFLCRAYSGDAIMSRQLYSNDEEFISKYKRAIILNGINCPIEKSDLVDRTILVDLKRIAKDEMKTEDEIYSIWERKKPHFLDKIFNVISKAIPIHYNTKLNKLERFADWQKWGFAIAEAIKEGYGQKFLEDIDKNRNRQDMQVIENNSLLQLVLEFMEKRKEWDGRVSDFQKELLLLDNGKITDLSKSTPASLSRSIFEQHDILMHQGIEIERSTRAGNARYIKLTNNNI